MAKQIDVYRDWLGITEPARPLTHYQLLRLKLFEDGTAKIREHYQKMSAHVRKFASGEYALQSQALTGELTKALLCLTDTQRKREYDTRLGRKDKSAVKPRTVEEILLADKAIDAEQLEKAQKFAKAIGVEVLDALLQQKAAAPEVVMQAYAESVGLPFADPAGVPVDETLVPKVPTALARKHSCVPLLCDGGSLLMASPKPLTPEVEEDLGKRFKMPVRTVLCTAGSVDALLAQHYSKDKAAARAKKGGKSLFSLAALGASPEEVKKSLMTAVIAFNLTVMVAGLTQVFLRSKAWTAGSALGAIVLAVGLGAVAAGATLFVIARKN
ncbi:MAG: hypothetical protein ABSF26_30470 [Thermoguttaceae bacterium]|jgi:hypothetical protein